MGMRNLLNKTLRLLLFFQLSLIGAFAQGPDALDADELLAARERQLNALIKDFADLREEKDRQINALKEDLVKKDESLTEEEKQARLLMQDVEALKKELEEALAQGKAKDKERELAEMEAELSVSADELAKLLSSLEQEFSNLSAGEKK